MSRIDANRYVGQCRSLGVDPDPATVARMDQLSAQFVDVVDALQAYIDRLDAGEVPKPRRWWRDGEIQVMAALALVGFGLIGLAVFLQWLGV